jgi:hypothetical protein
MGETPQYELSSGFTVRVKTLGPFALDPLRKKHRDTGRFTYRVETQAEGVVDFVYEPPDPPPQPPPEGDQRDWELYQAYLAHQRKRADVADAFERDSADFVMLNCFEIVAGPYTVDDDDWLDRLMPLLEDRPTGAARLLLFFKTQVFAIPFEEWAAIRGICIAPEVNLEGILDALESFRSELGRGGGTPDMGHATSGAVEP